MGLILNKKELAINLLNNARNELINKRASGFEFNMNKIESMVIDNLVRSKLKDLPEKYNESQVRKQVEKLYYNQLQPYYEKLMKETSNPVSKISVQNNLKNKVFEASDRTMEAVNGNREFISNAMDKTIKYDSSYKKQLLKEYERVIGSKPVASRQNILNEAGKAVGSKYVGKDGKPFYFKPATGTPELSYRQIGRIAYNTERNAIESVKMDKALLKNEERIAQGRDPLYIAKEWNWSGLENTRHSGMDGQVVAIEEPFIVTNEVTGDVDKMQHPQDGNGSDSNEINCGCGYTLLTKLMVEDRGLDPNDYYDYENAEEIKNFNSKYGDEVDSFKEITTNYPNEVATVFDFNNNKLLDKYSSGLERQVRLPEWVMDIGKQNGLELNMHSHTSKIPIPSNGDIINFITTKTRYGVVTSPDKIGLTTIKNNSLINNSTMKSALSNSYKRTYDKIYNEWLMNNSSTVLRIRNQYPNNIDLQKREIIKKYAKYVRDNASTISKEFNNKLNTYGINISIM